MAEGDVPITTVSPTRTLDSSCRSAGRREFGGAAGNHHRREPRRPFRGCRRSYRGTLDAAAVFMVGTIILRSFHRPDGNITAGTKEQGGAQPRTRGYRDADHE
jgi:hypothetical protein